MEQGSSRNQPSRKDNESRGSRSLSRKRKGLKEQQTFRREKTAAKAEAGKLQMTQRKRLKPLTIKMTDAKELLEQAVAAINPVGKDNAEAAVAAALTAKEKRLGEQQTFRSRKTAAKGRS